LNKRFSIAHLAYETTIIIKGIDGALETLAGLIIVITGPQRLYLYVLEFTAPELTANPHSHIVQLVQHGAFSLTQGAGRVVVTYLLIHGVLKLTLATVLLRGGGRWIFPVATFILSGFVIYLIHRWALHPSIWLLGFALFDFLTLLLVLNEWRSPARR
jgi:uncharacterized membrane protein